jgi:hypothetical protein
MPQYVARRTFSVILLPLLMVVPMARYPNAVEKKVVLVGDAAASVAGLFGLSSAGSVSLPLSRRDGWAVYLLKRDTPERLLNDNNQHAPTRYNVLTFSPSAVAISPYWLDLQTGIPSRPGYSFGSPFLSKESDTNNPWMSFLQRFKKEIPQAEWRAMEKEKKGHSVRRCFSFAENLELCIDVYFLEQRKQEGYQINLTVRDTALSVS